MVYYKKREKVGWIMEQKRDKIKISVRSLVEFICRSGDIDNTQSSAPDMQAMQEGSRLHRKIQKSKGMDYQAEVSLSIEVPISDETDEIDLLIEGRADGIIEREIITIDEIKCMYRDIYTIKEPYSVHLAQAKCYAYIVAKERGLERIAVQVTYCNIKTEMVKELVTEFTWDELSKWFGDVTKEYGKFALYQHRHKRVRDVSLKELEFPYEYRKGQKKLAGVVYRTIEQRKKLFLQAPTGVGKTLSTMFPTLKAMGEGLVDRVFYLTAKTITRTVPEECLKIWEKDQLKLNHITLTAKEKLCVLEKMDCNPGLCERAKGHYDRVNEAIYDMLINEKSIDRDKIVEYAKKHCVCPFEMSLDVALFADVIICDYNYVFDPNIYLKRFFGVDNKEEMVFLVDEAHNLVERAREMYSQTLSIDAFAKVKKIVTAMVREEHIQERTLLLKHMQAAVGRCHKDMQELKHQCEEFRVYDHVSSLTLHVIDLLGAYDGFLKEFNVLPEADVLLELYFDLKNYNQIQEVMGEDYRIYGDYDEEQKFRLRLQCMDPSKRLFEPLFKARSTVFFSATLLPVKYYREQFAGTPDDYAVYAESIFPRENRLILMANDVSTKYTRRNENEYKKIVDYIEAFIEGRKGNYLVFFPSYKYMNDIFERMTLTENIDYLKQDNRMSEGEREEFLHSFQEENEKTTVGFCVMGGIFSEGIDLKSDRLIGAVIVGTGLPMVCKERELFRDYYQQKKGDGFSYAYLYQGMNKVLQSGGRVIRTATDKGAILLLDERFSYRQYQELFPREWFPNESANLSTMKKRLTEFWSD